MQSEVPNALVAPAGSMGPLGDGWIPGESKLPGIRDYLPVLKTTGLHHQKGRPFHLSFWPLFKEKGSVNAMGLPWKSLTFFLRYTLPKVKKRCILSLHAADAGEMAEMVRMIVADKVVRPTKYRWIIAVEINLSCPNVNACVDSLGILREASALPWRIIAKIGNHQVEIALNAVRNGWVQGVCAINTIRWEEIFNFPSPLFAKLGVNGAVAGKPIRLQALHAIYHLSYNREKEGLDFLIFGGGGITDSASAEKFLAAGADRLVVGTLLTQNILAAMLLAFWWRRRTNRPLA